MNMMKRQQKNEEDEKKGKEKQSEIHLLEPKFIFGLSIGLSNNCLFLNDNQIIYHVSGVLVIYNMANKSQKYVYLKEPQKIITTMELNSTKDLIAVAKMDTKPTISIYDLTKCIRIHQLTIPNDSKADSFIQMKFTHDDSFLAGLVGDPDYTMYYFDWKSSKLDSRVQVINPPKRVGPVAGMAFNPTNKDVCCFVGNDLFRTMVRGDLVWKQQGFYKANKRDFSTLCWLDADRILAGTVDGCFILVIKGEIKGIYNMQTLTELDLNKVQHLSLRQPSDGQPMKITLLTLIENALIFVVNGYWVYLYKKKYIGSEKYTKKTVFLITRDKRLELIDNDPDLHAINTLCVSPNRKIILCVTKRSQLYITWTSGKFEMIDAPIGPYGELLHHGGVCALSVAAWKPVYATCGTTDRAVKFWNYWNNSLLLTHNYGENVLNVSIHPCGLYAVVTTESAVEFNTVLYNENTLVPRKRFDVPGSRLVQFSASGHMFAVLDGLVIHVYSSITFDRCHTVTGHETTITDIVWTMNDWKLISCDSGGRICQFNFHTDESTTDVLYQDHVLSGLAVTNNMKQMFTISHDGRIREIYIQTIIHDKNLDSGPLDSVALSKSGSILFVASENGVIMSLEVPIKSQIAHHSFYMHNSTISKMRLTTDDTTLITCSVDGSVCIWTVEPPKGRGMVMHVNRELLDNVLVSSKHLKEKKDRIHELNLQFKELNIKVARETAKLIKEYDGNLKQINDDHTMLVMRREEKEVQEMASLFIADKTQLENEINAIEEQQKEDLKILKKSYEAKLEKEDEKYGLLTNEMLSIQLEMKRKMEINIRDHKQKLRELEDKFNKDLDELEDAFKEFKEQIIQEMSKINVEIDEFDDQCDREMLELKINFLEKSGKWSNMSKKIKAQINFYRSKVGLCIREEEDLKVLDEKYRSDIIKKKKELTILDEKITEINNNVQNSNADIMTKDNWIETNKIDIETMKTQILSLTCNQEQQKKAIETLNTKLNDLNKTTVDMNQLSEEHQKAMVNIHEKCITEKKMNKFMVKSIMKNKMQIQKYETKFKALFYTFGGLESYEYAKIYKSKHMDLLERTAAHLKMRTSAREQKKPSHLKMLSENRYLLEAANKLRKQSLVNQNNYNNLVCMNKTHKGKTSKKVEVEHENESPKPQMTENDDPV